MFEACLKGDNELVMKLIKNGDMRYNDGLCGACKGGHKDLSLLMIENGANNWNLGLSGAYYGGHNDLILLMIEKGADINKCYLEFDIDYLLDKKVKEFGKFKELADLCKERRKLAGQVIKELNLRDVDSIICIY